MDLRITLTQEIFRNVETSKLSPYIKHGQIHVETIWEEALK